MSAKSIKRVIADRKKAKEFNLVRWNLAQDNKFMLNQLKEEFGITEATDEEKELILEQLRIEYITPIDKKINWFTNFRLWWYRW